MIHPWFTPEVALRFTLFSCFALLAGFDLYIAQGRHRVAVTGAMVAGAATGVILLVLAMQASVGGQPGFVIFALGAPAIVLSSVFTAILLSLPRRYAAAGLRRVTAKQG